MSYAEQLFKNWSRRREKRIEREHASPTGPVAVASTTWRPWAEMTAEEKRKALAERDKTK